jgi:hypothetical protein
MKGYGRYQRCSLGDLSPEAVIGAVVAAGHVAVLLLAEVAET